MSQVLRVVFCRVVYIALASFLCLVGRFCFGSLWLLGRFLGYHTLSHYFCLSRYPSCYTLPVCYCLIGSSCFGFTLFSFLTSPLCVLGYLRPVVFSSSTHFVTQMMFFSVYLCLASGWVVLLVVFSRGVRSNLFPFM